MSTFDQFANQGGAAAGTSEEAAAAREAAAELLLQSAPDADAADFGTGPLGSHPEDDAAENASPEDEFLELHDDNEFGLDLKDE
ncbi:MAG: hypothetical protein ABWX66_02225 [Lacisediminihabitans sp.]